MDTSQQDAVAAALTELGIDYSSVVTVAEVLEGPSEGVLEAGDRILTAAGRPVADVPELRAAIAASGEGAPFTLGIERDGAEFDVEVVPVASDEDGSPIVGILAGAEYDFPIEVDIQLENVGGPSAGMMFALGIV